MKIEAHITAVEDVGAQLKITVQGAAIVDATGDMQRIEFKIPDYARNRQVFTVGRDLTIEIIPK